MSAIVLIGPMGSGKSAVGAALAQRTGRRFVDLDAEVERAAAMPVEEIFRREGEAGFRMREAEAVRGLVVTGDAVVACGGGIVLDPANVAALRDAGTVVYLEVSPAVAAARVGAGEGRPLAPRLAELIEQRRRLYEAAAHRTVDADRPLEEVVASILETVAA
ncbi:MAG: shikimate kinase [Actinomycetota bacterium]